MDEFPNGTNAIVAVLAYTGAPGCTRLGWVRLAEWLLRHRRASLA